MKKAFTLIELMVAIGLLVMVMSFASVIFKSSIDSYRTASANAEIMRKLRAITDQLNADFSGLRKDGEIFVVWMADPNTYERFDRIMFFANGDFQSYNANPIVRGNLSRICYMLANRPGDPPVRPINQEPKRRMLARTQHIFTADTDTEPYDLPYFNLFTTDDWYAWNNIYEYEKMSSQDPNRCLEGWKYIPWSDKKNILSVIADVIVDSPTVGTEVRGANVNPADADTIHMLLCEGVGEFEVQGWSWDGYRRKWRWVPEVDPDGDGTYSDFFLSDPRRVPGLLYPYPPYGFVSLSGAFDGNLYQEFLNENSFNFIPGLGRALKFTFTLYDSRGVIKNGRTFTYIVYLD